MGGMISFYIGLPRLPSQAALLHTSDAKANSVILCHLVRYERRENSYEVLRTDEFIHCLRTMQESIKFEVDVKQGGTGMLSVLQYIKLQAANKNFTTYITGAVV
jgi:hypothetical protein